MPLFSKYKRIPYFYFFWSAILFFFLISFVLLRSIQIKDVKNRKFDRIPNKNDAVKYNNNEEKQVKSEMTSLYKFNSSDFLSRWKKIYNYEKESFYMTVNSAKNGVDYNLHENTQYSENKIIIDDITELHLHQLYQLEILRDNLISDQNWKKLKEYIEKVIWFNQNPANCKLAEKVVCDPNKECGFACQFHHMLYCFSAAMAKGKVLLFRENTWHNFDSISDVFLPVSTTCSTKDLTNTSLIETLDIVDFATASPFFPTAVPNQILKNISEFHANPFIWWIGQLSQYLFRVQPLIKDYIDFKKFSIQSPIVGIHIRRTDKIGTEAEFHELKQYMHWANLYFEKIKISKKIEKKYIYLATDEEQLFDEAQQQYPEYIFISNKDASNSAKYSRNGKNGTLGIIADIYFLSLTDYLVCTFSSQVCRLAYELMNGLKKDASFDFESLDEIYYFGGQQPRDFEVDISHKKRHIGEVNVPVGQKFNLQHNDWNHYSKIEGLDKEFSIFSGHIPSYKIIEIPLTFPFKAFDNYETSLNKE